MVGDKEDYPNELDVGFLIHKSLKERWTLIKGDSLKEIPKLNKKVDLYIHDSEHSFHFVQQEMSLIWGKISDNAMIIVDDLDWSNGFYGFCVEKKIYPLIITDNGKSGLRARTGIVKLGHPLEKRIEVVG